MSSGNLVTMYYYNVGTVLLITESVTTLLQNWTVTLMVEYTLLVSTRFPGLVTTTTYTSFRWTDIKSAGTTTIYVWLYFFPPCYTLRFYFHRSSLYTSHWEAEATATQMAKHKKYPACPEPFQAISGEQTYCFCTSLQFYKKMSLSARVM